MTAINQTSTGTPVSIVTGDELFINSGVDVVTTSTVTAAVTATGDAGADIFNFGTIFAIDQTGIDWAVPEGNIYNAGLIGSGNSTNIAIMLLEDYVDGLLTITNTATGLISGQIKIDETGTVGSSPETGQVRLINNGEINVPGSVFPTSTHYGADLDGAFSIYVINTGTISADEGIYARTQGADDNVPIIRNSGIIDARIFDGIDYQNVSTTTAGLVENSGKVTSVTDNAIETSGLVTVRNTATGLIQGDVDMAGTFNGINHLWNAGEILGQVFTGTGDNRVFNSGKIAGDLNLESGDDLYRGSDQGAVSGDVLGGTGNDTLIGSNGNDSLSGQNDNDLLVGHEGADTLLGASGLDTLIGGPGDDSLVGGTGGDTLNGGAGADEVFGDAGNDILLGRNGDDFLDGGENDDTIDAGAGDDQIEGGDGDDIMRGRAGEDQFKPGLGRDVMTGGEGADTFIFATTAIAGMGPNRDVIQDFEQGTDLINVVAMAPGAFDFIGTSGFSGTGLEIRVIETAAGTSIVEFDADGNGTADAQLKVTGVLGLTADDFAL